MKSVVFILIGFFAIVAIANVDQNTTTCEKNCKEYYRECCVEIPQDKCSCLVAREKCIIHYGCFTLPEQRVIRKECVKLGCTWC